MRKWLAAALPVLLLSLSAGAYGIEDARFETEDVENFTKIMNRISSDRDLPLPELVVKVAKHLVGTRTSTLTIEKEPEMLTVNTRQTECILFVEMCVALSLTAKEDNPSFEKYLDHLRRLRYRGGVVDGYASRLHYTSEWVGQGIDRGIFREMTAEMGGVRWNQEFNYLSTHTGYYPQLKKYPDQLELVRKSEIELAKRKYWYIPKEKMAKVTDKIENGDIILFNSSSKGLDIGHIAIACWEDGTLTFIHASSTFKKVIVNPYPLADYIARLKRFNGIRVVRLVF